MFFSFNECLDKYGNQYQISKAIETGQLFKIESGSVVEKLEEVKEND